MCKSQKYKFPPSEWTSPFYDEDDFLWDYYFFYMLDCNRIKSFHCFFVCTIMLMIAVEVKFIITIDELLPIILMKWYVAFAELSAQRQVMEFSRPYECMCIPSHKRPILTMYVLPWWPWLPFLRKQNLWRKLHFTFLKIYLTSLQTASILNVQEHCKIRWPDFLSSLLFWDTVFVPAQNNL